MNARFPMLKESVSAALVALAAMLPVAARAQVALLHYDSVVYAIKTGAGSRAVILLPGLASGSYIYSSLVRKLSMRYVVYTVDFAGFDGQPPAAPPYLDHFEQSLAHLIRDQKLQGVVLLGEHFGGQVALRTAADLPDRVGGVLVIDTLPSSSTPRPAQTEPDRTAEEARVRYQYSVMPKAQFASAMSTLAASLVTAAGGAAGVSGHIQNDDQATFGGTLFEYSTSDIRPSLASIAAPVELLVPFGGGTTAGEMTRVMTPFYAGLPHFRIQTIGPSRHLMMFDQPGKFESEVERFVGSLPATRATR